MAGDWIKLEHSTPDKPEVHRIADLLGVRPDEALGILCRFLIWLDRNSRNGSVTHVYAKSLDTMMHCEGLTHAIADVGWLTIDDKTGVITLVNHDRHNGTSAKTRALTNRRVKRLRNEGGNDSETRSSLTEKRRYKPPIGPPMAGFDLFWLTYPKRVKKQEATVVWNRLAPDESLQARIVSAVAAAARSPDWLRDDGKFIPHPSTWLNGRRWEDETLTKTPEQLLADKRRMSIV